MKWLPHILEQRNWDCPEDVEMAKWKIVLSDPLPEGSITIAGRYSIRQRLAEAVRIRNVTQHRQPCNNDSIRKMISSAQNLVEIFFDADRFNKLGRLRDEIGLWETSEGRQHQAIPMRQVTNAKVQDPRRKLHDALQEITEHSFEFDEMDWALDQDTPKEAHDSVGEIGDEMEWE